VDQCPYQFRQICALLVEAVSKKFEDTLSGVKNFLFLRYICPTILAPPKSFGLDGMSVDQFHSVLNNQLNEKNSDMNDETRRSLILISKIMQNVVNGLEFKEPYMKSLNQFVKDNSVRLKEFIMKLAQRPTSEVKHAPVVKSYTIKDSLKSLHNCMVEMKDPLLEKLHAYDAQEIIQSINFKASERLVSVCSDLGMPKKGKKIVIAQNDPKVDDLILLLIEEDNLTTETALLAMQEKEKDKLSHSLIYILATSNAKKAGTLVRSCIQREFSNSAEFSVADSTGGKFFQLLCPLVCGEYLKELLSPHIDELAELKEDFKPFSDKLLDHSQKILGQIVRSLPSLPIFLWEIGSFIFEEMKKFKSGPTSAERVATFLFQYFFCPALESPDLYGVCSEPPKKKVKKSLQMISEMLMFLLNMRDDNKDARITQLIKQQLTFAVQHTQEWLQTPSNSPPTMNAPLVWATLEEFLRTIHQFLCDKIPIITSKLGSSGTNKKVSGKLADLVFGTVQSGGPARQDVKSGGY